MKRLVYYLVFSLIGIWGCKKVDPKEYNEKASEPQLLHTVSTELTDVMIHDIFKPTISSRIYAYSYLAAYETLRNEYPSYPTFAKKLNTFGEIPKPDTSKQYCYALASIKAFIYVGRTLTFSADLWDKFEEDFIKKYKNMGIPDDVYKRSVAYGEDVAKHVIKYSGSDFYKQTRGFRYTVVHEPGKWVPTPPTYADACEPRWNTLRNFTLDTCSQFMPPRPAKFDLNKKSEFYKLTTEVYEIGKHLTKEQKDIAFFWDDNAFVTNIIGHVTYANKKMSPAGHWIAITQTVAKDKKLSMIKSLEAYTLTSIALYDGFISAWDEKYRSLRIRPITVINDNIDPKWEPFLETPGFPEYVSGHSTISAAAGTILTHLLGDNVTFTDSTEYRFGHGVRTFKSFKEAYQQVSDSRVYGGIHYRDGVEAGMRQGEQVGEWVWKKLTKDQKVLTRK